MKKININYIINNGSINFMYKLNIKKLAKKFNFNFLEESIKNDSYEFDIFQVARVSHISKIKNGNYIAAVRRNSKFSDCLKQIEIIIFCEIDKIDEETKKLLLSYNKPVLWTKFSKREVVSIVDSYLLRKQQKPLRIHGTFLSVYGEGILVIGKSGIGKSELAIELMKRNHLFIGDDAIDIITFAGKPFGRAPKISRDFCEVRGVGIVNVKGMFGIQSVVKEHVINLIVELVNLDDVKSSIDRIGNSFLKKEIMGIEIPMIQIPISSGRSIASVLEVAVISFKQRMIDNYKAVDDFTNRMVNEKKSK